MGRRSAMNMKMVLPTISWVAVMRLLKRAPSGVLGIDAASKALLGCSALPNTPSLRYTDHAYSPQIGGGHPSVRRPKSTPGAALLGCASRPHTDSFRIHHVVNQEALQLVLAQLEEDKQAHDIFYEPFECEESLNCSFDMIIRDGDRLLHDVEAASASVMSSCSSRLSNCTAASSRTAFSAANTAFSRSDVDSEEGHYSTASSASFQVTPGRHHPSCSSPDSYSRYSAPLSAGLDYSADTDGMSEISANSGDASDCCEGHSFAQADGIAAAGQGHADRASTDDDVDACHARDDANAGGHNDDEEVGHAMHDDGDDGWMDGDDGMVAETCYSEDPLRDFEESIEELVRCHQLIGQPDELHALYCRYIQLNPPTLHPTIALAFFHTLQRLA